MTKFDLYKLAIEARDRLNENYHRWMTFYYVAIGSILVAFMNALIKMTPDDNFNNKILLTLGLIATIISLFWHLSCKGYYYWSKSWIEVIIRHEKELISGSFFSKNKLGVYSVFSKKVQEKKGNIFAPYNSANISTPKLTLVFSYISIICWLVISMYFTNEVFLDKLNYCCRIVLNLILVVVVALIYGYILPKIAKSKIDDSLHQLI